ncbi:MAG: lipase maturation factor family protein [Polyangiaceae bacterium]|nr:lipase maturation factor family protein [Polyangiaceae bacterium]
MSDAETPAEQLRLLLAPKATYEVVRFFFLRGLGVLYAVAFSILLFQFSPLLGSHGLLPAARYVERVQAAYGGWGAFARVPSIFFWIGTSDATFAFFAWLGFILSVLVALGLTNAVVQFFVWAIYLSFVHVGQVFYGYGWEMQLSETGFLAVFLCPIATLSPFAKTRVPIVPVVCLRWLIARIMLGAGLIKLRGDPCWRDFTCLVYHYETQPIPGPLTVLFHSLPVWAHKIGVGFNHLVEVVAPFFAFGPRKARIVAGCLFVSFQVILILSGNLAFLNWLTLLPAIACFDDRFLARIVPKKLQERLMSIAEREPPRTAMLASVGYGLTVAVLSIGPVLNLLSPRQAMNTSFDPFNLVGSYGAFGSVGKERYEIVIEGTSAEVPDADAEWIAYEFPCKPGDPNRRPCLITPYHYRLDWQIWFAAFRGVNREPWLAFLMWKLLLGEPEIKSLLANDPFPAAPPRYIRADLYRYQLVKLGDPDPAVWRRTRVDEVVKPVSKDSPELRRFLVKTAF